MPLSPKEVPPSDDGPADQGEFGRLERTARDSTGEVGELCELTRDFGSAGVKAGGDGKEISTTSTLVVTGISSRQGTEVHSSNGMVVG